MMNLTDNVVQCKSKKLDHVMFICIDLQNPKPGNVNLWSEKLEKKKKRKRTGNFWQLSSAIGDICKLLGY